ncbi:MAG: HlyD family secretion protein [Candidatus Eremiobacteraeota bacterium]|nr:HlyD family secretion protein [Candidatus Eremiobacteraeota bacterium]MBV9648247.1 HlyD family secretion protein [Candidatus Eremiobacteraeota bacterium]
MIVVVAIAVLAALIAAVRYFAYASSHETTDDAKIDANQIQVTSKITERVDRVLVDTNQYVHKGQLLIQLDDRDERARLENALATRNAYRAQENAAQANVALTRDEQAAQNQQSRGAIESAQAGVASAGEQAQAAQQQVGVASAGVADAEAQLRAAQSAVPGALQNLRKAQADLARTSSLVSTGDIARSQLDSARAAEKAASSNYAQTEANVGAAQANVSSARQKLAAQASTASGASSSIGTSQGNVVTAQGKLAESASPNRVAAQQASAQAAGAQVATAQTSVNLAQNDLSYTQIRSPIDGYVGQKSVDIGQTVAPGTPLLTIVPVRDVYITANYKETQLGRIRVGQPVDINVDAYSGVKFHGYVDNISPASQNTFSLVPAQNASGNFVKVTQRLPVRIRFIEPDARYALRPGMSVETSIKVK